jgi:hypothetical protein
LLVVVGIILPARTESAGEESTFPKFLDLRSNLPESTIRRESESRRSDSNRRPTDYKV